MSPKRFNQAIEAAAEAGHDAYYEITPDMSDLGYAFESDKMKRAWREVALAMLKALEDV